MNNIEKTIDNLLEECKGYLHELHFGEKPKPQWYAESFYSFAKDTVRGYGNTPQEALQMLIDKYNKSNGEKYD